MKHFFTLLGIAGIAFVAITATNVFAQTPQPTSTAMPVMPTSMGSTMTPMPRPQSTQPAQPQQTQPQQGWGMGMRGKMMGGGMMSGQMSMSGGMHMGQAMMQEHTTMMTGGSYDMDHVAMMAGAAPMYDDVARMLGMTTQDLYNQMASGKSMNQIAAMKGISQQQLMDGIMAGRRAAYDQAIKAGMMTQAQANAALQNMSGYLNTMINAQGYMSGGWSMMWGVQPTPQAAP
jgi:hypothetical protein